LRKHILDSLARTFLRISVNNKRRLIIQTSFVIDYWVACGLGVSFSGRSAPEPSSPFFVLPNDQDGGSIENGRECTAEYTDQQDDNEMFDGIASKKDHGKQSKHNC
jgi:hypothetical protein